MKSFYSSLLLPKVWILSTSYIWYTLCSIYTITSLQITPCVLWSARGTAVTESFLSNAEMMLSEPIWTGSRAASYQGQHFQTGENVSLLCSLVRNRLQLQCCLYLQEVTRVTSGPEHGWLASHLTVLQDAGPIDGWITGQIEPRWQGSAGDTSWWQTGLCEVSLTVWSPWNHTTAVLRGFLLEISNGCFDWIAGKTFSHFHLVGQYQAMQTALILLAQTPGLTVAGGNISISNVPVTELTTDHLQGCAFAYTNAGNCLLGVWTGLWVVTTRQCSACRFV